jgi:signal transduction histidine kinase
VFTVSDRGPGVPEEDARRIFEPFYRARTAAPDAGRAGLGLSIARTLAEIQGGALHYTPRAGGGSVFSLHLPAAELGLDAFEQPA